jgi:hypothetical protein
MVEHHTIQHHKVRVLLDLKTSAHCKTRRFTKIHGCPLVPDLSWILSIDPRLQTRILGIQRRSHSIMLLLARHILHTVRSDGLWSSPTMHITRSSPLSITWSRDGYSSPSLIMHRTGVSSSSAANAIALGLGTPFHVIWEPFISFH